MARRRLTSIDVITRKLPADVREAMLSDTVNVVADAEAAYTLPSDYVFHDITLTENAELTFPADVGPGFVFQLVLRGAYVTTWPASVVWPDNTEPTYATPGIYRFITFDGGTTWFGSLFGKAFA